MTLSTLNPRVNFDFPQERADLERRADDSEQNARKWADQATRLSADVAREQQRGRDLEERMEHQKAELEQLQQRMSTEFENIANRLLSQRGKELNEQHQERRGNILKPLQERIVEFQQQVRDAYEKEGGAGAAKILPAAFGIGVQNYAEKTGSLKESQFTDAAEKYGKAYDYVRPKVGEPEAVYKQRVERVEGWMSEYGDKLLSHPSYSLLTESQKQAAIENLRRRIGTQQNATRPRLESLAPEKVIQSVLKSEATRPKREAGKLWSPPARP